MKGKNIRKETKIKKPVQQPEAHDGIHFTDKRRSIGYRILHNNYEAEVRLDSTDELVGVYRAATRNWKKIQSKDLTNDVKIMVEHLYQ